MINFGRVIAHRGASGIAPENTLLAFVKARELGASWAECDVRFTRDKKLIVFHDDKLKRLTRRRGFIRWKTHAALSSHHLINHETIPTLKELLDLCAKLSLSLNIEIKPNYGQARSTATAILTLLAKYPNLPVCISSFNLVSLTTIHQQAPHIPLSFLVKKWHIKVLKQAQKLNCISINLPHKAATLENIQHIKSIGCQVLVYTINNKNEAEALFHRGVDAVFSDYPDLLLKPENGG